MKIRIKRRPEPATAPQPAPRPPQGRVRPPRPSAPQQPVNPGPFRPLAWAPTRLDVTWTSEPTFGRSPHGWYRIGFFA